MSSITNPIRVRQLILDYSNFDQDEFGDGRKGVVLGKLNEAVRQFEQRDGEKKENLSDHNRRLVLGFIFTNLGDGFSPVSSKELILPQWRAIERWIYGSNPRRTTEGNWIPRKEFKAEACWILNVARVIQLMTDNARAHNMPYRMDQLLSVIEKHVMENIPFTSSDEENECEPDPDNSGMVAESLNLPGGVIVKSTIFGSREAFSVPENFVPESEPQRVIIEEDDEFIV